MNHENVISKMSGQELVRLAKAMKVPLTQRTIPKEQLVSRLAEEVLRFEKLDKHSPPNKIADPAIEIRRLRKDFGNTVAVKNLNLKVSPGEIVGLVGPNGAGKTTTLRVLTGIIQPSSGSVFVNGYNMKEEPTEAKERIGYIPERPTCYPNLRVSEYLSFVAKVYDVPQYQAVLRMSEYSRMFQLHQFMDSYVGTLSKGNLQRTLLVGIFMRPAPYILALDEPIYGLDPRGAWSLKGHLRTLRDSGSAILISTHILEVAEALCDRFVIMNESDVVGRGTLADFREELSVASLEEAFLELTGGIPRE